MRKTPFLRISILKTTVYQGRLGTPIAKVEKKRGGFCRQVLSQHPVAQHHDASHDDARLRRGRPRGSRQQGLASYLLQDSARGAFLKTTVCSPHFLYTKNDHIIKTGKGLVQAESTPQKRPLFISQEKGYLTGLFGKVRTRVFLSAFIIKMLILPRQARDKHRENSEKNTVFL